MTSVFSRRTSRSQLAVAVHQNAALSSEGLRERLFTLLFSGLVYPQIWEDPVVDMDAMAIGPNDHVVAIASGGCNIASYLTMKPARVSAVDLNAAHIALVRLKMTAIRHLEQKEFQRFFGHAAEPENPSIYDRRLKPVLDEFSRTYWEGRNLWGRQRIAAFSRGFYRYGLLGRFIGAAHVVARLHGADPRQMLAARTRDEQFEIYERVLAPLFSRPLIKWLASKPASLYGLGIPPAQYRALAADHADGMTGALRERVKRLACGFPLRDNYFAWQAFGRSYGGAVDAPVPPYLEPGNFQTMRTAVDRVGVHHQSMTEFLAQQSAASADCYVLLDAQDWMNDQDLNALWSQITRTARPGARVIFRTAANERLLPGRLAEELLSRWTRDDARSDALHLRDRSAIYGMFHLYRLDGSRQ